MDKSIVREGPVFRLTAVLFSLFISLGGLVASPVKAAGLKVQHVTKNIYAIIGPHEQRNSSNLANNATFGVVITDDGVLLVDPGGSYKGAAAVDRAIKTITDKPVKIVINSGGQDHRWLGNGYFKERGARIITSAAALEDHNDRTNDQFFILTNLIGDDALVGTEPVYADETFDDKLDLEFGGHKFELRHNGPAHTLGDLFVWMPETGVMFSGDIVYIERLLAVGPADDAASWIESFEAMAAFKPTYIVPGHGPATDLKRATRETYDYLVQLRAKIGPVIENGGSIKDGTNIDQSKFGGMLLFDQLAKRNAQAVFIQMEFD
jgi:glyoxylase-like metal-dependent hydrolase (beta-lactamase superfamily II)